MAEEREAELVWCREHLEALCRIDTTSGREAEILPVLVPLLEGLEARVELQAVGPGRVNVLATWGRPRVLLTTHLDTVAPFLPPCPLPGGLGVKGRGACDAKGQIVAQLATVRRLRDLRREPRAGLAWLGVVGEETDGAGACAALDLAPLLPELRAVIGGEPTENRLATSQPGFLHVTLRCQGRRGHGAHPDAEPRVENANGNALWRLHDWLTALRALPATAHPQFGVERFNLGRIEGGEAPNVVAGSAFAEIVVRTVPDSSFLDRCRRLAPPGSEVRVRLDEPPAVLSSWPGLDGEPVAFGSDVPRLARLAPSGRAFLLGPGSIRVAHTDDEYLLWNDLAEGIDRLEHLVRGLLGDSPEPEESPAHGVAGGAS